MLRGTSAGLEFVFAGEGFDDTWADISSRLAERPDFYRGSQATAIFESAAIPSDDVLAHFLGEVGDYGIALRGVFGPAELAGVAERHALAYLGEPPRPTIANIERKRAARTDRVVELTERARSLDADFAGARADIANRRARGEPSVPRPVFAPLRSPSEAATVAAAVPAPALPATLYHRGTLRGGQLLQQLGSIVVVGDVNPGAEIVATGDIIVFGALRGTAHAGAQGDAQARVYALELAATQLRIATFIAADDGTRKPREPQVAYIESDRITIAPHARVGS
jgi:septum formation inhibitor MinC